MKWAAILVVLMILPFCIKLIHEGCTQNFHCDPEQQAQSLREDEIVWVSVIHNQEAYIKGNRVDSLTQKSTVTPGPLNAPSRTASSASVQRTSLLRSVFRSNTPALITTAQRVTDGVSQ